MSPNKWSVPFFAGIVVGAAAMAALYFLDAGLAVSRNPAPAVAAAKNAPGVTMQSGVVLLPGETLVTPPPQPATPAATPPPSQPQPPAKEPAAAVPTTPRYAKPPAVAQAPRATAPSPPPPRPEPRNSFQRSVCLNCGIVTSVTRSDYDWEVRVRFDDGSRDTLRYYDRPRLQVGDTFHMEQGRLIPD